MYKPAVSFPVSVAPSPLLYGSSSSSPAGHPGVSGTPEATTIVQKVHDTEMASTTTIAIYSVNVSIAELRHLI